MTTTTPTVFIVDDDPSVLKSLSRLMRAADLEVAAFDSPQRFLDHQQPERPGCLVLDVAMPGLNGLDLQAALARANNRLPIIFITGHGDIPMSVRAMKAGAIDFLAKPLDDETLLAAIHLALEKDGQARRERSELQSIAERVSSLTPREHEVMLGVVAGKLNKQIAADLGTVEKTIKVHRARVMQKMRVESVAELVRLVERWRAG